MFNKNYPKSQSLFINEEENNYPQNNVYFQYASFNYNGNDKIVLKSLYYKCIELYKVYFWLIYLWS